jgi:hypothetical protein
MLESSELQRSWAVRLEVVTFVFWETLVKAPLSPERLPYFFSRSAIFFLLQDSASAVT